MLVLSLNIPYIYQSENTNIINIKTYNYDKEKNNCRR